MRFLLILLFFIPNTYDKAPLQLALMKYNGGGDWYANPTAVPNLARYCNDALGTSFDADYATVEVGSAELFNYPFVHMTGHGNVEVTLSCWCREMRNSWFDNLHLRAAEAAVAQVDDARLLHADQIEVLLYSGCVLTGQCTHSDGVVNCKPCLEFLVGFHDRSGSQISALAGGISIGRWQYSVFGAHQYR